MIGYWNEHQNDYMYPSLWFAQVSNPFKQFNRNQFQVPFISSARIRVRPTRICEWVRRETFHLNSKFSRLNVYHHHHPITESSRPATLLSSMEQTLKSNIEYIIKLFLIFLDFVVLLLLMFFFIQIAQKYLNGENVWLSVSMYIHLAGLTLPGWWLQAATWGYETIHVHLHNIVIARLCVDVDGMNGWMDG